MRSSPAWFRPLLGVGLLLLSGSAEARFGKRSADSDSSHAVHDASPVGSRNDAPSGSTSDSSGSSDSSSNEGTSESTSEEVSESVDVGRTGAAIVDLLLLATEVVDRMRFEPAAAPPPMVEEGAEDSGPPLYTHAQESAMRIEAERRAAAAEPRRSLMVRLGANGQALGGGSATSLRAGIEGEFVGVDGEVMGMELPTDDGTPGTDELRLFSLHLTLAVYASDHARVRVHAGMGGVSAPDLSAVSPSVGVSFERCLIGALDVEGRGQLVPLDYLQVDAQAGLAAHLGALSLRAGWRWMMLDDRGAVDGVAHRDVFSGPYAGAGLYF